MRLFEILDQMNQADAEKGTTTVGVLSQMKSLNQFKNDGDITMGLPLDVAQQLVAGKRVAILLVIDKDVYDTYK